MSRVLLRRVTLRPASHAHPHVLRRLASSTSTPGSPNSRLPVTLVAVLGGTSFVTAYFLWPDNSRSAPTYENAKLSPTHFTPVTVVANDACSNPDARLMTLAIPPQSLPNIQDTSFSPIWSIFIKDDDIQVERPYTPLEGVDEQGNMKFWIKKISKRRSWEVDTF